MAEFQRFANPIPYPCFAMYVRRGYGGTRPCPRSAIHVQYGDRGTKPCHRDQNRPHMRIRGTSSRPMHPDISLRMQNGKRRETLRLMRPDISHGKPERPPRHPGKLGDSAIHSTYSRHPRHASHPIPPSIHPPQQATPASHLSKNTPRRSCPPTPAAYPSHIPADATAAPRRRRRCPASPPFDVPPP